MGTVLLTTFIVTRTVPMTPIAGKEIAGSDVTGTGWGYIPNNNELILSSFTYSGPELLPVLVLQHNR